MKKIILLIVAVIITVATLMADGSDPMPLCRKAKPPQNCPTAQ